MIKMSIFGFENKIIFDDKTVNVLEIQNQKLFCNVINDINEQCNNEKDDNNIVLLEDNKRLKIDKEMYLLLDIFNIEFNSKKIINKIYSIIEQNIKNRQDNEIENITLELRKYLIEEVNEIPLEFCMEREIDINDVLKAFNVKIDITCYTTILEKIEFIINILSTMKVARILVIPNLKTYLNNEELLELYKYSIYNNVKLLLIENSLQKDVLKYENKNIVDENFDEF